MKIFEIAIQGDGRTFHTQLVQAEHKTEVMKLAHTIRDHWKKEAASPNVDLWLDEVHYTIMEVQIPTVIEVMEDYMGPAPLVTHSSTRMTNI